VLEALGVRHVFAYPGSEITDLLEALRTSRLIETVVPTSELGGTFMALGYARAGGTVGVTAVIPGPGLAYSLPGLAEARYDSDPLLVLTGAADPRAPFDLGDSVRPVVKELLEAGPGEVAEVIRRGHALATSGEPGPVVVRLPPAALSAPAPAAAGGEAAEEPEPLPEEELASLLERLRGAARPLLLLGAGAAGAAEAAAELAERAGAVVLATTSGRGIVPESHPRSLAVDSPGHGSEAVNALLSDADLVVSLGCRFNPNAMLGGRLELDTARLVDVDAGPPPAHGPAAGLRIRADVPRLLEALVASLPRDAGPGWPADEVARRRAALAKARDAGARTEPGLVETSDSRPASFFEALRRTLPEDGVLVLDSGLHQMVARRHFEVLRPRTLLAPTDFQSMGFAVPAAIGAALARPDRHVVALLGDGGFAISGLELITAARSGVSLTVVVLNDGRLNLIRLNQLSRFGREHAVTQEQPEVAAVAAAVGAGYARLTGDPEPELRRSIEAGGLRVLELAAGDTAWLRRLGTIGAVRRAVRERRLPRG
jgi:acetolactate synthase I/II/III large subunit